VRLIQERGELSAFDIFKQGWVIRRRRIIRRIVFIAYITVFVKLLRIIRFWAYILFAILGGGWCKPRVPPKIAKIRFRIIRVCRINSVLYRMGRLKSPYDPSLFLSEEFGCY